MQTERIATALVPPAAVTTTGRSTIASMSRIATCGWLITGVAITVPNWPGLVIVKVPSRTSSADRARARARVGEIGDARRRAPATSRRCAPRITGTISPSLAERRRRCPRLTSRVAGVALAVEPGVEVAELRRASRPSPRATTGSAVTPSARRRASTALEVDLDPRGHGRGGARASASCARRSSAASASSSTGRRRRVRQRPAPAAGCRPRRARPPADPPAAPGARRPVRGRRRARRRARSTTGEWRSPRARRARRRRGGRGPAPAARRRRGVPAARPLAAAAASSRSPCRRRRSRRPRRAARRSVPPHGAGSSESILSVETSQIGSSASTALARLACATHDACPRRR